MLASPAALAQPAPASVDVCFVPAERCEDRIVAALDAARAEILVQAYGFSSRPIVDALVRASRRGVGVRALLDRSNEGGRGTGATALREAGVPVWIDHVAGIAHVKAMVIDRHLVIGGSYNFTASAQRRNVEDVTFSESPVLAERFRAEWGIRQSVASEPTRILASNAESADIECPGDTIVWINIRSRVYHFNGDRYFGHTAQGKFACRADADAAGDRPSQGH